MRSSHEKKEALVQIEADLERTLGPAGAEIIQGVMAKVEALLSRVPVPKFRGVLWAVLGDKKLGMSIRKKNGDRSQSPHIGTTLIGLTKDAPMEHIDLSTEKPIEDFEAKLGE